MKKNVESAIFFIFYIKKWWVSFFIRYSYEKMANRQFSKFFIFFIWNFANSALFSLFFYEKMPNQQFFILFYCQNAELANFSFLCMPNQHFFHFFLWIIAYSAFFHKNSEWKRWFSNFFIFLYENLPIQCFFFTEKKCWIGKCSYYFIEKCQIGNLASFNMWKTANSVFLLNILLKKSWFSTFTH